LYGGLNTVGERKRQGCGALVFLFLKKIFSYLLIAPSFVFTKISSIWYSLFETHILFIPNYKYAHS